MDKETIEKVKERTSCCPCLSCLVRPTSMKRGSKNEVFVNCISCNELNFWYKENISILFPVKNEEVDELFTKLLRKKFWEMEDK